MNPVQVTGVETAVDVDVGSTSACARLADGTMACWGSIGLGRLGSLTARLCADGDSGGAAGWAVGSESSTGCAIWGDARQGLVLGMEQVWASR